MVNEKRLIDATAVLENKQYWFPFQVGGFTAGDWFVRANDIRFAPTVDAVEVVHAEWGDGFVVRNGQEVCKSIICSNCEGAFRVKTYDEQDYYKEVFEWCPFCGAKMDGGN